MEYNFKVGQRLVVELTNNQIYEGDCMKCAKNRIDIVNIVKYPNGKNLTGQLSYYNTEIRSVHLLDSVEESDISSSSSSSSNKNDTDIDQVIKLPREEYTRLLDMTHDYVYMATVDKRYLDAMEHLMACESIGVVGIDYRIGRFKPLQLLLLCSWDQIYIFDIFLFNKKNFQPELKMILESESTRKIVHDSRKLVDCLWHCHKVKLNNIFDTSVAGLHLIKKETGVVPEYIESISKSLHRFLNFPISLLEGALEVTDKEWEERPLSKSMKTKACQLVVFLITLKDKQEKLLLSDFYKTIDVFSQLIVNADGFTVQMHKSKETAVPEKIKQHL